MTRAHLPWTLEDYAVYAHLAFRNHRIPMDCRPQDRRDADRMLAYQEARQLVGPETGCILGSWETALPQYEPFDGPTMMELGLAGYIPKLTS